MRFLGFFYFEKQMLSRGKYDYRFFQQKSKANYPPKTAFQKYTLINLGIKMIT